MLLHTCLHTYTPTDTLLPKHTPPNTHTYMHTPTNTQTYNAITHIPTHEHLPTYIYQQTHSSKCTHAYTPTYLPINTHILTCTPYNILTYTHIPTYTQALFHTCQQTFYPGHTSEPSPLLFTRELCCVMSERKSSNENQIR